MRKSWLGRLILSTAVALAGCGDSGESFVVTGPPNQATGTVVVNQVLFQGVPGRVDGTPSLARIARAS